MIEEKTEVKKTPTPAVIKAFFDLQAGRINYQSILQHLSSIKVTADNVKDDLSKEGRDVLKALERIKDESSKRPLQWHRDILSTYKDLATPLEDELKRIANEKKAVVTQLEREKAKQFEEQKRVADAKQAIVDFTNKVANLVKAAKDDSDIVAIEKMIGLEKTRTTIYQEFIPDLIVQCDALRPQIRAQKEAIRELKKIADQEADAEKEGDISKMTELRGRREHFEKVVDETAIRIHEKAFEQATTIDIVVPEVADDVPNGRTNWKWRVDDIRFLQKKMPHLVKLVPDDEAISLLIKTKKADGSLKGLNELNWNGITFFNDKTFTK